MGEVKFIKKSVFEKGNAIKNNLFFFLRTIFKKKKFRVVSMLQDLKWFHFSFPSQPLKEAKWFLLWLLREFSNCLPSLPRHVGAEGQQKNAG